jgi:hypothetical protein
MNMAIPSGIVPVKYAKEERPNPARARVTSEIWGQDIVGTCMTFG